MHKSLDLTNRTQGVEEALIDSYLPTFQLRPTGQFNTVTYSASYDGDGQLVYESSNTSPGSFTAAYIAAVRQTLRVGGPLFDPKDKKNEKEGK